jgi:hypothetical protein
MEKRACMWSLFRRPQVLLRSRDRNAAPRTIVGYGGESIGFPWASQFGPLITTFPQASLQSRRVGPDSGNLRAAAPT